MHKTASAQRDGATSAQMESTFALMRISATPTYHVRRCSKRGLESERVCLSCACVRVCMVRDNQVLTGRLCKEMRVKLSCASREESHTGR